MQGCSPALASGWHSAICSGEQSFASPFNFSGSWQPSFPWHILFHLLSPVSNLKVQFSRSISRFLVPPATASRGTGWLIASFIPSAAGGAFRFRIFHRMGKRENFFQIIPSAGLTLDRIVANSYSIPDLGNLTTSSTTVFIDRHFFTSLWLNIFLYLFARGKKPCGGDNRIVRSLFS